MKVLLPAGGFGFLALLALLLLLDGFVLQVLLGDRADEFEERLPDALVRLDLDLFEQQMLESLVDVLGDGRRRFRQLSTQQHRGENAHLFVLFRPENVKQLQEKVARQRKTLQLLRCLFDFLGVGLGQLTEPVDDGCRLHRSIEFLLLSGREKISARSKFEQRKRETSWTEVKI